MGRTQRLRFSVRWRAADPALYWQNGVPMTVGLLDIARADAMSPKQWAEPTRRFSPEV
jgi:hypothetical protein